MRRIDEIVIHCADTPVGKYFDVNDIREWHVKKGWKDVGYHFVILLNGIIQFGRPIEEIGAHVKGHNAHSIGICYIGGEDGLDTRTNEQKESLEKLLYDLKSQFPGATIMGHNNFPEVKKKCPGFDAQEEYGYI